MEESKSNPETKLIYSNSEILALRSNNHSYVKPLAIVRIWRRKIHFYECSNNSPRHSIVLDKLPVRSPIKLTPSKPLRLTLNQDKITPKIMGLLNKLTPLNKDKLKVQLYEIASQSDENLKILVEKIFQKACFEKKYTGMWASLCLYLTESYKNLGESQSPGTEKTQNKFKTALLTMSQTLFEDFQQSSDSKNQLKKKIMGNINFIGELFKLQIVPSKTIVRCLISLLDSSSEENKEEKIEGASILLMSCGNKCEKLGDNLGTIFEKIEEILKKCEVSARIKFLLMDVIDAKNTGWDQKTL